MTTCFLLLTCLAPLSEPLAKPNDNSVDPRALLEELSQIRLKIARSGIMVLEASIALDEDLESIREEIAWKTAFRAQQ